MTLTSGSPRPYEPSAAVVSAVHQGNRIEAIKIVRQETGLGLKEAKDLVDDYVRRNPALAQMLTQQQSASTRRALFWVAAVVVLALMGYLLLR